MNDKELKPCPFCKGKAEVVVENVEPQSDSWYGEKNERFVKCSKCGCCLFDEYFHDGFYKEQDAIKAWNTRPQNKDNQHDYWRKNISPLIKKVKEEESKDTSSYLAAVEHKQYINSVLQDMFVHLKEFNDKYMGEHNERD